MIERFIQKSTSFEWPEDTSAEVGKLLREGLPRAAARRMTRLGLLCTKVLREMPASPDVALVYATGMGEAQTLEKFLASFPDPSPTAFQASIHPAGAQQALIALQRPVREFYPLAGGEDLLARALRTCCSVAADEVILLAGEERGGWLREAGLASDRSFAFALHLSTKPDNAEATLHFHESTSGSEKRVSVADGFDRIAARQRCEIPSPPAGAWELNWL